VYKVRFAGFFAVFYGKTGVEFSAAFLAEKFYGVFALDWLPPVSLQGFAGLPGLVFSPKMWLEKRFF